MGFTIYCVKGNHEIRPSAIPTMKLLYDEEVDGEVWYEEKYPNIKFFKEVGSYQIGDFRCLVIGGAYSVDKYYRISNYMNKDGWCGWFSDEQLTAEEMKQCEEKYKGQYFDFVFSHTCPYSKRPTDLFLSMIDQNTVDNSMELWMDKFMKTISYGVHLWGHYHDDRVEAPYCEMMFHNVENLYNIFTRWTNYTKTKILDLYAIKSPKFYLYEEEKKEI